MTMLEEIKQRDAHLKIASYMGASPEECDLIETQRDRRWLLARVEELEKADIMRVLYGLQEYAPKGCGRCGTPSAACDGDCVTAAYISLDIETIRKDLVSLTAPVSS